MAGSPIKRARKEAARKEANRVGDQNACGRAGTDYSKTLEWYKKNHPGEWSTQDLLLACQMEVHLLGMGRDMAAQRLSFLKAALDCRKQLWTEQGGDSEHRLVLVTKSLEAPPLAEMLNVPPPIETIALPLPADSTADMTAITLTSIPDTTK